MRFLNVWIAWLKARIAPVHNARVVPEPHADLVETYSRTGEQAGERMPHGVRRYPFEAAQVYVQIKRSGEVVTITVFTVSYFGSKHVWFSKSVLLEEIKEIPSQWHGAFLTVFEANGAGLAQMQEPGVKIEPERARLDDLVLP